MPPHMSLRVMELTPPDDADPMNSVHRSITRKFTRGQPLMATTANASWPSPSGDRVHTPEELLKFALVKRTEPSAVFHMVVRRVQLERRSGRSLTAVSRQTVQSRWSYHRLGMLKQLITDVHRTTSAMWKIRNLACPRMVVSRT